jgi:hypothetical protein
MLLGSIADASQRSAIHGLANPAPTATMAMVNAPKKIEQLQSWTRNGTINRFLEYPDGCIQKANRSPALRSRRLPSETAIIPIVIVTAVAGSGTALVLPWPAFK